MTPDELVTLMNEYLSAMTDIIESHGGYVDKYIGDSIVAIFGAPVDDPDHAGNAVRAALNAAPARGAQPGLRRLRRHASHRIGLNSGDAVVGNIGSRPAVQLHRDERRREPRLPARRRQQIFRLAIIASETTVRWTADSFAWRELDAIRVKGRMQPLKIFELLAAAAELSDQQKAAVAYYAEGLAHWRAGEFVAAAACFDRSAKTDRPASIFSDHARQLAASPPDGEWNSIRSLESK